MKIAFSNDLLLNVHLRFDAAITLQWAAEYFWHSTDTCGTQEGYNLTYGLECFW